MPKRQSLAFMQRPVKTRNHNNTEVHYHEWKVDQLDFRVWTQTGRFNWKNCGIIPEFVVQNNIAGLIVVEESPLGKQT